MATIWCPDYPPASPSAYDDEFSDGALAGSWTELDNNSVATVTEGDAGLTVSNTGATFGYTGVFRAVPAGDFSVWTKVSAHWLSAANNIFAGLFLAQDLVNNPTTADFVSIDMRYDGSSYLICGGSWSDYDSYLGAVGSGAVYEGVLPNTLYLRIRFISGSGTFYMDYSTDGIGWQQIYTYTTSSITHFGVGVANGTGSPRSADFAFVRCVTGTPSLTDVMPGRRIDPDNPPSDGIIPVLMRQYRARRM